MLLLRRADAWLFGHAEPAERLAALRIGLCALLLFRLVVGRYAAIAGQPAALFRPVGVLLLLPAMPPPGAVRALQIVSVAACGAALAGWRARFSLPLAWAGALVLIGMTSSLGKIVHNDVLLLLCLVPLLFAPVSDVWALDARKRQTPARASARYGWPVRTAMVVVAGAYFFCGLAKLLNSGPAWVTSDNLRWALYAASDAMARPNTAALFVADRPWLSHLLALGTLGLEMGFPVALVWPRVRPLLLLGVAALHASVWVCMGLNYSVQTLVAILVFANWPPNNASAGTRPPPPPLKTMAA